MMKKYRAFLLTAALILTLSSCASGGSAVNVTASKVKADSLLGNSSYSASLQAVSEVTVVPKVADTVAGVNFKVGDSVEQGDVIFTLDSSDLQNRYNQAKAAYEIAEINYENTKNGNAASARLKLQQAVDAAKIGLDSATIAYNTAKDNYDKINYLVSIGEESTYNLRQAESSMNSAQLQVNNAQLALTSAQQNLDINNNTLIPESINAAEKQVQSAKAALDTARSALDDTRITAPIGGIISVLNATVGEMASAQTANVTVIDPSSMDLVVSVTGSDVVKLREGMSVGVTLNDIPKEYTGTIKTISPSANAGTALFDVTVHIDNSAGELKTGMMATARFGGAEESPALYVPQQSVIEDNGNPYVYKVTGSTVEKTPVTLGAGKNLYVEIKSGLTAEDTVVVDGADRVNENSTVNIVKNID